MNAPSESIEAVRPAGSRRVLLFPALLGLAVALTSLPGDFVFDDVPLVERDAGLRSFDLERIFASNYWGPTRVDVNYRPTVLLSYALQHQVSHAAWSFHLVNALLEGLNVFLACLVLRELLGSTLLAMLAGALWTVLPIRTEAIANIVGRAELLAAASALGFWLIALRGKSWRAAMLGGVILLLGLGAKESALVAVPIAALSAWMLRRSARRPMLVGLLALGLYLAAREPAISSHRAEIAAGEASGTSRIDNPLVELDRVQIAANGVALLARYAAVTIVPWRLSADHSHAEIAARPLEDPALWGLSLPVLATTALGLFLVARRRSTLGFALVLFPLAFAVTGNVLFPIGTILGERLAYLPSLAWPLAIVALLARLPRGATVGLVIAGVLAYGSLSVLRHREWQTREQLYLTTAASSPGSVRAQTLGASAQLTLARRASVPAKRQAHFDAARAFARRAVEIDARWGRASGKLAEVTLREADFLRETGRRAESDARYAEAEALFKQSWAQLAAERQSEPLFLFFRALALFQLGRLEESRASFEEYLEFTARHRLPVETEELHLVGLARVQDAQGLLAAGEFARADAALRGALGDLDRVLARGASRARVETVRGVALALQADLERRQGHAERATALRADSLAALDRAVGENPSLVEARTNRGYARFLAGELPGALEDYRAGLALCEKEGRLFHAASDSAFGFHRRIAEVLVRLGREDEARAHVHAAESLRAAASTAPGPASP